MTADSTVTEPIAAAATTTTFADIAIVGGGLAGSLAASVLARAGHRVALVDKRAVYPDEFRVEKIGGQQLEMLRRLGFIRSLASVACPYDRVLNVREGKVVDVSVGQAYGLPYAGLVAMFANATFLDAARSSGRSGGRSPSAMPENIPRWSSRS